MAADPQRLYSRPGSVPRDAPAAAPGRHAVDIGLHRPGYALLPRGHDPARAAPLALMLHGAGGDADHGLRMLQPWVDATGTIVLAAASGSYTWDLLLGGYGPDVAAVDRLLRWTLRRCEVDAARLAVGGFSDGASYALSLGLDNGELFTHVIALSPGFAAPRAPRGRPAVFVSHGTRDAVLPIDPCSRRIVPQLQRAGYTVDYREFDGAHAIPPDIARAAARWFESTEARPAR